MIPFGTFMQAVGSTPATGSGGTGNGNPLTTNNGFAQAGGEAIDSFSAWVRKLTGDEATVASDGEASDQLRDETSESEALDWDQLVSMIDDVMEQSSEISDDGQTIEGIELHDIQNALQQLENTGLLSNQVPYDQVPSDQVPSGQVPSDQAPSDQVPSEQVPSDQVPSDQVRSNQVPANLVMRSVNGSDQDLSLGGKPLADVQEMPGSGQEGKPHGKEAFVSGAMVENNAIPGLAEAAEPGFGNADLVQHQDDMNPAGFKQSLRMQQNKERPVSMVDSTVAQPAATAEEESPEVNAQRLNDGTKKIVQGDNPVSPPKDSSQTQQPLVVSTGKDDGNSTAADEDGPDNRRVVRSEIQDKNQSADAGEKELPKGSTSSDPVKTVSPEQNRFSDTVQDATRTMTEKSGAIQTAPSERAEATAAQRFQATVMDQIVDKANLRSVQGRSEIQIRLKPDFLGNVQMNIAADKEQVVVRMITDHPVVKEVVEANLHHLKTELQHQGLTIDRFEVTVNPDAGQQQNREPFAQMFKNPSLQNGQGQDPEPEPETHHGGNGQQEDRRRSGDDQPEQDGINYFA